jgi:flavin reductase (DIM6/NTAB) family NADH-FMN oxidoreductase RutF
MSIDNTAMFKLSYGLFVLTAREGDKDNGCIINTATQVTSSPNRIAVTVNKQNYTHGMILRTGVFNLSVLTEETDFWVFQHYGFQSGRDVDKFENLPELRTENGLRYAAGCSNAVISAKVVNTVDCGTHTLFIAEVTDAHMLSSTPSVTYQYYFDHIKPKPQPSEEKKWVCKICGYVYEGKDLPPDYICPWCKHGIEAFELR